MNLEQLKSLRLVLCTNKGLEGKPYYHVHHASMVDKTEISTTPNALHIFEHEKGNELKAPNGTLYLGENTLFGVPKHLTRFNRAHILAPEFLELEIGFPFSYFIYAPYHLDFGLTHAPKPNQKRVNELRVFYKFKEIL